MTAPDLKVEPLLRGTMDLLLAHPLQLVAPLALLGLVMGSGGDGRDAFGWDRGDPLVLLPFHALGAALSLAIVVLLFLVGGFLWILTTRLALATLRGQGAPDVAEAGRVTWAGMAAGLGTYVLWGLGVLVGLLLLVVPGAFVIAAFLPWAAVLVAEGKDGPDGLRRAWDLTERHRWDLFLLALGAVVAMLVAGVLGIVPVVGDALAGAVQGALVAALAALGALFYVRRTHETPTPPVVAAPAVL